MFEMNAKECRKSCRKCCRKHLTKYCQSRSPICVTVSICILGLMVKIFAFLTQIMNLFDSSSDIATCILDILTAGIFFFNTIVTLFTAKQQKASQKVAKQEIVNAVALACSVPKMKVSIALSVSGFVGYGVTRYMQYVYDGETTQHGQIVENGIYLAGYVLWTILLLFGSHFNRTVGLMHRRVSQTVQRSMVETRAHQNAQNKWTQENTKLKAALSAVDSAGKKRKRKNKHLKMGVTDSDSEDGDNKANDANDTNEATDDEDINQHHMHHEY